MGGSAAEGRRGAGRRGVAGGRAGSGPGCRFARGAMVRGAGRRPGKRTAGLLLLLGTTLAAASGGRAAVARQGQGGGLSWGAFRSPARDDTGKGPIALPSSLRGPSCSSCRAVEGKLQSHLRAISFERKVEHDVDRAVCDGLGNLRLACRLLVPKFVPEVLYAVSGAPWCRALGCKAGAGSAGIVAAGRRLLRGGQQGLAEAETEQAAAGTARGGLGGSTCDVCEALVSMAHSYTDSESFKGGIQKVADTLCDEALKGHDEGVKECHLIMSFLVPEVQNYVANAFEDPSELCTDIDAC